MPVSAIYEGLLRHRRFGPIEHAFRYRLFMLYLDLEELPGVLDDIPLWSARGRALGRFDRRDHFGPEEEPLATSVRRLVLERTGRPAEGPIRLLTQPRTFGHGFNPVSFFYCFDRGGERVETVVAEVENTPWGERHLYVLGPDVAEPGPGSRSVRRWRHAKEMHVSPFMGMDLDYDWRFRMPDDRLAVHVETRRGDDRTFAATLILRRRELTRGAMVRTLLLQPAMSLRTLARIYWQAARLWLAGAPFHDHPGRSGASADDRRPNEVRT